jgi:hypothetical protein
MLSQQVTRELREELSRLRKIRDEAQEDISAIEQLLSSQASGNRAGGEPSPKGLRQSILEALEAGGALKPREITAKLEAAGYSPGGKTPLKTQVANECYRMKKSGSLKRTPAGKYALAG